MSLITWLPLIDDIKEKIQNKTISDFSAASGPVLPIASTSGKLGQGYKFSNSGIKISDIPASAEMSFSLWIKLNENKNCHILDFRDSAEKGYQPIYYNTASGIQIYSSGGGSAYIADTTIADLAWHHLVITMEHDLGVLYIDGQKKGAISGLRMLDLNVYASIGCRLNGANPCSGLIQDIRIYDHILSQAEVKELSKGLIIHYTFDDLSVGNIPNLITGLAAGGRTTYDATNLTITTTGIDQDTYFHLLTSEAIVEGKTYILSCIGENIGDGKQFIFGMQGQTSEHHQFTIIDGYNEFTFTANNYLNGSTKILMDDTSRTGWQNKAKFSKFRLEKREPYALSNSTDTIIANETGFHQTKEINALSLINNAAQGKYAGSFNGMTSYIDIPFIKSDLLTSDYTLNFWVYPLDDGRAIYFGDYDLSGGTLINFERSIGGAFRYWFGGGTTGEMSDSDASAATGQWTMLTVAYNSTTKKIYFYKNGISTNNNIGYNHTSTRTKASGVMRIGRDGRSASNSADKNSTPFYGYMDDFRFYATCLSANDIQDLYETSVKITDLGDIICSQINEISTDNLVTASSWEQGGIHDDYGTDANNMNNRLRSTYIPVMPNVEYYYAANTGINVRCVHYYDKDLNWIKPSYMPTLNSFSATTPANCSYIRFVLQRSNASNDILLADVNNYGAIMTPKSLITQTPLAADIKPMVDNKYTLTCLDICEGHEVMLQKQGKIIAREIIEI